MFIIPPQKKQKRIAEIIRRTSIQIIHQSYPKSDIMYNTSKTNQLDKIVIIMHNIELCQEENKYRHSENISLT
jgi:hypothetical protein